MAKRRKFKKRRRFGGLSFKSKPIYSRYEAAYKFFAVTAVCSLISSAVYALLERQMGGLTATLVALLFGAGGVWLGYGIAAVWGHFTACERVSYDYAYERSESYFSFGTLIPAVITALLPSVGAFIVTRNLTAKVLPSGKVIYDTASATPPLIGGALFICLLLGIILWFLPYNKVISLGNAIPIGLGFMIVALAGLIFFGASTAFLTVAFVFYIFTAMAVINQGYLLKIIKESGTGASTSEVRKYNLAAVALAFGAIAVTGFFATAVIVGVVVTARIIFFSVFKGALNNKGSGGGSSVGSSPSFDVSKKIFGGIMEGDGEGQTMFYYILFIVMILAFIITMIIYRKKKGKRFPKPSEIINRLYTIILAIISWIGAFFSSKRKEETDISLDDYTDEELIMNKSAIRSAQSLHGKRGARRFAKMMSECKTDSDRLELCYKASRARYIKKFSVLKDGDTPSALLNKMVGLTAELEYERFSILTEAFIKLAYANIAPDRTLSNYVTAESEQLIAELSES